MNQGYFSTHAARGFLKLSGEDHRAWLQGLISVDIEKLSPSHSMHGALLSPQGKFLFHMFLYALDDGILIETPPDAVAGLQQRLTMYKLRARIEIEDVSEDHALTLIWSEDKAQWLEHGETGHTWNDGVILAVDPRLPALGLRRIGPPSDGTPLPFATEPVSIEHYRRHVAALGVFDPERDLIAQKTTLLEANFDYLNGVDFEKGCYVGQELTARMHYRSLARRRHMPVCFDGTPPEPGTTITASSREIGHITSAAGNRGLALIRLDRLEEARRAQIALTADGCRIEVTNPTYAQFSNL